MPGGGKFNHDQNGLETVRQLSDALFEEDAMTFVRALDGPSPPVMCSVPAVRVRRCCVSDGGSVGEWASELSIEGLS